MCGSGLDASDQKVVGSNLRALCIISLLDPFNKAVSPHLFQG